MDPDEYDDDLDTDAHNARVLATYFENDIFYVPDLDHWFEWAGNRWRKGPGRRGIGAVKARVLELVRADKRKAMRAGDTRAYDHARACENKVRIHGIADLADNYIRTDKEDLNTHDDIIVTPDAYIDLCDGRPMDLDEQGRKEHLLTVRTPVEWHRDGDPRTTRPVWERCLREWFHDDDEVEAFQRLVGYALTGTVQERLFVIVYGPTGTGKTTCLNALKHAVGEYGATLDVEALMAAYTDGRSANPSLAMLEGTRLVVTSEVGKGRRLNEALMKRITGKGIIRTRMLYQNPIDIRITWTIFMDTNHLPRVDEDDALFDRLIVPVFDRPVGSREGDIDEVLRNEAPGILRWAVEGAVKYHHDGLRTPEAWLAAKENYRLDSTPMDRWHMERIIEADPTFGERASDVLADLDEWWAEEGLPEDFKPPVKKVKAYLLDRGYDHVKRTKAHYYMGLRLASSPERALAPGGDDA